MKKYNNIAIIWQPHFLTDCFRVDIKKQQGKEKNYIIVCCSPSNNGVWVYKNTNKQYDLVRNKSLICRCVPTSDCEYMGGFEIITDKDLLKEVKKEQNKWFKAQKDRKKKPEWML